MTVAVTVYLTYKPVQPHSPVTIIPAQTGPSVELTSAFALQNPNNSSQVSALAYIIQLSGTSSMNFTCGQMTISLTTSNAIYTNVYTTSDFVNASTFNNIYRANFTSYQRVAPNCSIIELNGNGDQVLQPGETFTVFLNLNSTCLNCPLSAYQQFRVELTPAVGATLTINLNMPTNITPVMNLAGSN